jgi:tetratricopeptide (TPR) repeat protein
MSLIKRQAPHAAPRDCSDAGSSRGAAAVFAAAPYLGCSARALAFSVVAATLATIVGCAAPQPAIVLPPGQAAVQTPAPPAAPAVGPDGVPNVNVTGGLMFQLLAAEQALQRGDPGTAFATYLGVARGTKDPRLARRAVEIALAARANPQAVQAARMWVELAPESAEAVQTLGALLVASGEYAEATPLFAKQLKAAANPAEELARLQQVMARAPDRKQAFNLIEDLAKPYLQDAKVGPDMRLSLALAAFGAGDTPRAEQEARAALAQRPDFERAALTLTQLLAQPSAEGRVEQANRNKALEVLAPFVQKNPQARGARSAYARLLVGDGKVDAARAQFEELVKSDPNDLESLYALAVLTLEQPTRRAESRALFERYVKLATDGQGPDRDPDAAYLNLARLAEEERDYKNALVWLDKIEGGEQYLQARMRKALVLGKLKRVDEGRKLLTGTPTENAAEKVQLTLTEGQLLREAGRYKDSYALLSGALAKAPDDTALLYDAAMAAEKLDRMEVMEKHLRRLIELKPEDAHAYNALGYSLAERNVRLPEAYELIERALKLSPTDGYIMDSMGWVYFRMSNLAKAREWLQKAWDMRQHAEVGAHFGEVLWALGEREPARAIWRESMKLEPDNETLRSTLRRLKVKP